MPLSRYLDRDSVNAPSDLPSNNTQTVKGIESSESNRIREYRAGDSLKHVHWKLSSKVSELQVNEYKPNEGRNVYVFCDYSSLGSEDEDAAPEKSEKIKKAKKKRRVKLTLAKRADSNKMSTDEKLEAARDSAASRAEAAAALEQARRELEAESLSDKSAHAPDVPRNVTDEAPEAQIKAADATVNAEEYYLDGTRLRPECVDDMDAFVADGVSEIALGAVMHELEAGSAVTLMWFDSRTEMGFASYPIESYADLDRVFVTFATAPFAEADMAVTRLPDLIENVENPSFLFATARAEMSNVADFAEASNRMGADSEEVLFFNPKEHYVSHELRGEYTEALRARFAEHNIILTESRINR